MKKILQKIFSIKRENERKVITILGIKIKYKKKKKENVNSLLENIEKNIKHIEFRQNLIMDYFMNASDAKAATGQLRKFQLECFELLKVFDKICESNDLTYWLDFGSLLGAIRHGGFIPWDDDLDVSMPKSSFEKLRKIAPELLQNEMAYIDKEPGKMARFYHRKNSNAFLDIYCYEEKDNVLQTTLQFVNFHSRKAIRREILLPTQNIEFEGNVFKAPNKIDTYLRIRYGNYSLLPKTSNEEIGHVRISEYL